MMYLHALFNHSFSQFVFTSDTIDIQQPGLNDTCTCDSLVNKKCSLDVS